ncbi:MAG: type IV secretion system DNA-binding domain-containing protein [Formivibrio sp.]|nr:type IV secretion system DNA-binding domain-containing protein [Formivibrio sp.]
MAELQPGELGLFQVLWQPVRERWAESILESVTGQDGKPFFVNAPELTGAAENKAARPLFAAVVRIMVCAGDFDRILQLASDLAGSLRVFSNPDANALIPLQNEDYPFEEHIEDVLRRQTRRTGMLLSIDELTGFVHIPSSAVRSPAFLRQTSKTKAAPGVVRLNSGLLLGENEHAGQTVEVRLSPEQRVHHCHVIGASGTGKSTLLFNLIRQDIENGEGVAVLDPHGDLIDRILGIIPQKRIDDVILVNPVDDSHAIGFNILSAHSGLEKNLLASDLVAMFQRLSTTWGDQMNSILQNAILAFLESDRGGTIADLLRFLTNESYQNEFLTTVKDSRVVDYWQDTFPGLGGKKSIGSILTRLDTFLAQKPIRYMVSQPKNRLDFAHIMDNSKILLARLPEGLLGRENSHLLGTLLVSKFQQITMSRQAQMVAARRDFWIYIDEFANFITPTMAEILSGARKYRIGLTLAHHELHQLQRIPEVASAVLTHPYTRIFFRVGDDDAKKLGESLSSFEAKDLRNLEIGQAICRVERSDFDFNLSVPLPVLPDADAMEARRQEVITSSRKNYGTERADVEAMLAKSRAKPTADEPPPTSGPKRAVEPKQPVAPAPSYTPPPAPVIAEPPPTVVKTPQPDLPPPLADILKAAPSPIAVTHTQPREPRPGRGGPEHQAIQKRIKEEAEKLGFRSTIEKPVLEGQASIDVWLERNGLIIACEVSFTNTEDNESGKIIRCLKGGIPKFAMICTDEKKLRKIETAVFRSVEVEMASRVEYFQPDPFIEYLKSQPVEPAKKSEKIRRGYKVKHSQSSVSTEEQKAKEDAAIRAIAESMQTKKKP